MTVSTSLVTDILATEISASINFARPPIFFSGSISLFSVLVSHIITRKVILCSRQHTAQPYIKKAGVFKAANVYSGQPTVFN